MERGDESHHCFKRPWAAACCATHVCLEAFASTYRRSVCRYLGALGFSHCVPCEFPCFSDLEFLKAIKGSPELIPRKMGFERKILRSFCPRKQSNIVEGPAFPGLFVGFPGASVANFFYSITDSYFRIGEKKQGQSAWQQVLPGCRPRSMCGGYHDRQGIYIHISD